MRGWLADYSSAGSLWLFVRRARPFPKPSRLQRRRSLLTTDRPTPMRGLDFPFSFTSGIGRKASRSYTGRLLLTRTTQKLTEYHGLFLGTLRRFDEGIAEEKRAEALDPLLPPTALGYVLTEAHRYDEAFAALNRALELEPDSVLAHVYLARLYGYSGKGDLAIAESRRAIELGFPFGQTLLAQSYAAAGRKAEAVALLKKSIEQSKRSHAGALFIAFAFDALGDKDQAFSLVGGVIQGARRGFGISQRGPIPQRRLARRPAIPGSRPPYRDSHAVNIVEWCELGRFLVAQASEAVSQLNSGRASG